MDKFAKFARIAEIEFANIIISAQNLDLKLRIYLVDKSFIDFFYTQKLKTIRFSIHWERTHIDKTIYRLDNTPDKQWKKIPNFPLHFHKGKYDKVVIPPFQSDKNLTIIFRSFLLFVRNKLKT